MNNRPLFVIKSSPWPYYLIKVFLVFGAYCAYTKYEQNPLLFTILMTTAIGGIFLIGKTCIMVTNKELIIEKTRWVLFFNKSRAIKYSEIENFSYQKKPDLYLADFLSFFFIALPYMGNRSHFRIRIKDGEVIKLPSIGTDKEKEQLTAIIYGYLREFKPK